MKRPSRSISNIPVLLALVGSLAGSALSFTPAHAGNSIHVNTASDVTPADDGVCTLREAINSANTDTASGASFGECAAGGGGYDSIYFDGAYTITLDSLLGTLSPTSDMYFWGNGLTNTIIQASTCDPTPLVPGCTTATYPVLTVTAGNLNLYSLTLQYGATAGGGGGIYNNGGNITLNYSLVSRNYSSTGAGGIYNQSGNLNTFQSTIDGNVAVGGGGGVYNQGTIAMGYTTVSNNTSRSGLGGGIGNVSGTGFIQIYNSTLAYNDALTVGALWNAGTANVFNVTVSDNTDSGGYSGLVNEPTGSLTLKNSLLANGATWDCYNWGTMTGDVNNLIEANSGCGTPTVPVDPGTLTWGLNGGYYVNTLAIDGSSAAFEAGDYPTCVAFPVNSVDQTYRYRKLSTCDIGAYEFHPAPANDEYAAATAISTLIFTDTIDVVGATMGTSPADPVVTCTGAQQYQSVWYEYTPSTSGALTVNTFGSNYQTVLEVWEGTPGTTSVACNYDVSGNPTSVAFPATGGTTYFIEVASYWPDSASRLTVNVLTRPTATVGVNDGSWFFLRNANSAGAADLTFSYGWAGPTPVVGDWDANGTTTLGIDDASWFFLRDSNSAGPADNVFQYGWAGAAPVIGDWDSNGSDTVGIYDAGTFFLRNSNSPGPANYMFSFGWAGATPLVGDWDGNGTPTVGIYDGTTGTFFLRDSNTSGAADHTFSFGPPGAKPIVGDWNGDGITTIGVVSGGTFFLRNSNTPGPANVTFPYAWSTANPVMGDWDGLP